MKRLRTYLLGAAVAVSAFIFLAAIILAVVLNSGTLDAVVKQRLTDAFNREFRGTLIIGDLDLRFPSRVVLHDIALYENSGQKPDITIPTLTVDLNFLRLASASMSSVTIRSLHADSLRMIVKEQDDGLTSVQRIFSPSERQDDEATAGLERLFCNHLSLNEAEVRYIPLDHQHPLPALREMTGITTTVRKLVVTPGSLSAKLQELSFAVPAEGFRLQSASARIFLSDTQSSLFDLALETAQSRIEGSASLIDFNLFTPEQWHTFSNSRAIVSLDRVELHTSDISVFVPQHSLPLGLYTLKGRAEGELRNLALDQLKLGYKQSEVSLSGDLLNINQPEFLAFRLLTRESVLSKELVRELAGDHQLGPVLEPFGDIGFSGVLQGDIREFFSDLELRSEAGTAHVAITTSLSQDARSSWDGNFSLEQAEIYRFFPGDPDAAGILNASGTILASATASGLEELDLTVKIDNSFWKEQEIDTGLVKLLYRDDKLTAGVELAEKRATLSFDGKLEFSTPEPRYSGTLMFDSVDPFKALGTPGASSDINATVTFRGNSFQPDRFAGSLEGTFRKSFVNSTPLADGSRLSASITRSDDNSTVTISSDFLDFTAEGNYTFREFRSGLETTLSALDAELRRNYIWGDTSTSPAIADVPADFSADYSLEIRDISPLALLFPVDGYRFTGSLSGTSKSRDGVMELTGLMNVNTFETPGGISMQNASLDISMQNTADFVRKGTARLRTAMLDSPERSLEKIDLQMVWQEQALDVSLTFRDMLLERDFRAAVQGYRENNTITLNVSEFRFGTAESAWIIPAGKRAEFGTDYITLYDLQLQNGEQSITCSGLLSAIRPGTFSCRIQDLDITELRALLPGLTLSGRFSSSLQVSGTPGAKRTELDFRGRQIAVDSITLGNPRVQASHNGNELRFTLDSSMPSNGTTINEISGTGRVPLSLSFTPPSAVIPENRPIDIRLSSTNLSAAFLEILLPFFDTAAGTIPAELVVQGTTPNPEIFLNTRLDDTKLTVTPTEAVYRLTGDIEITPGMARIKRIAVADSLGGKGVIDGSATLENLEVTSVDLQASMDNLILFDKQDKRDNSSYGLIRGSSSNLRFFGPVEQPVLTGSFMIDDASFTLYSTAANESAKYIGIDRFITFVPRYPAEEDAEGPVQPENEELVDAEFSYTLLDIVEIRDLRLRGAPDLRYNMVFDRTRGEKLETTLQNLSLVVNKHQQQYELFGSVNVSAGKYYFSNTSFDLDDDGRIVWNSVDIREGVMENLFGRKYITVTDRESGETDNVRLLLAIEGTLNAPDVQMGYFLNDDSQPFASSSTIGSQSSKIDPNAELNTVSLLLAKQWYVRPGSRAAGGGLPFSNVGISTGTGLISSQISRLLQEAAGIESFNLNLAVDDEGEVSGLEFSFALIVPGTDGKMRFLGTGISNNTRETELFNYYGNSQRLEYRITPKLFFEGYRSYGLFGNDITTTNLLEPTETYGVSLSYRQRFYSWGEFWESIFGGKEN